jgi:hypothetical protein
MARSAALGTGTRARRVRRRRVPFRFRSFPSFSVKWIGLDVFLSARTFFLIYYSYLTISTSINSTHAWDSSCSKSLSSAMNNDRNLRSVHRIKSLTRPDLYTSEGYATQLLALNLLVFSVGREEIQIGVWIKS